MALDRLGLMAQTDGRFVERSSCQHAGCFVAAYLLLRLCMADLGVCGMLGGLCVAFEA